IGLEAIFIGETYKKLLKHLGNKSNVECGRLEIERTGVLEQIEMGRTTITCNDSFIISSDNNNNNRYDDEPNKSFGCYLV
ncbi:Complement control protein-like protein, partial [Euroglyphus maynei]